MSTRPCFLLWIFSSLLAAGIAVAQGDHPASEPRMIDIPDQGSPAIVARAELSQGQAAVKRAETALAEAAAAEGKKREKLEKKVQKSYEEAVEHFLTAVRADDELLGAYAGLGTVWLATDQPDKALQVWGAAQKLAPQDAEILFGLGRSFVILGRPSEAASVCVALDKLSSEKAAELLDLLRAWGEPRAQEGNEQAKQLLAWIDGQG